MTSYRPFVRVLYQPNFNIFSIWPRIGHLLESSTSQIPLSASHICLSCTSHTSWLRTDAIYAHGTEIPYKIFGCQTATEDLNWCVPLHGGENVGSDTPTATASLLAAQAGHQEAKIRRFTGVGGNLTMSCFRMFEIRCVSSLTHQWSSSDSAGFKFKNSLTLLYELIFLSLSLLVKHGDRAFEINLLGLPRNLHRTRYYSS